MTTRSRTHQLVGNFLIILLSVSALFKAINVDAQDTLKVSYSEEADTLVKQRFIDRYENVFMTKIPTRQMFKVSTVGSRIQGTGINFAYEYKVLPSFSLEASIYSQLDRDDIGLAQQLLHFNWQQVSLWANAKARWYYNMDNRIRKGLNANNFSGTYLGFSYEQSLGLTQASTFGKTKVGRLGLLYGFQSRFFNRGHIDFSVGLFQKEAGALYIYEDYTTFFQPKNFVIGTQANIGLAFGDWKKTATAPFCDVLVCDETIQGQWKVELPNISVGLKNQIATVGTAYERKIGQLPLSVSADFEAFLWNIELFSSSRSKGLSGQVELRYYFMQPFQMRRGKAGSNFSGPYVGAKGGYSFVRIKERTGQYGFPNEPYSDMKFNTPVASVLLGYQQRLFKRIYIDGSLFWEKKYAGNYIGATRPYVSSKIALGFTF